MMVSTAKYALVSIRAWVLVILFATSSIHAGGGGQNMLLVVNPDDENSVRIANAYQQLRDIPDRNIVFLPGLKHSTGLQYLQIDSEQTFRDRVLAPIDQAINDRGLSGQIDYIGTLGLASRFRSNNRHHSVQFGLMNLPQILGGTSASSILTSDYFHSNPGGTYQTAAHNTANHFTDANEYMVGTIGFTGQFGNTVEEVITSLSRAAGADGAKPDGTVYFEDSTDIRTTSRRPQWSYVKRLLDHRGINWVQENGTVPLNRTDVRGAVIGRSTLPGVETSTYLPGSWADNLTSYGAAFANPTQTKATALIAAGAAGTSGTIEEPGAQPRRFPEGMIHIYLADGGTLGESYTKSIYNPDMQMFFGDLLVQPYADVPSVNLSGASGAPVVGTATLNISASLNNPTVATGISKIDLYVDGQLNNSIPGSGGSYNLDTTQLSDGMHEIRAVAINNAAIESQGYTVKQIFVSNHGRSVSGASSVNVLDTTPGSVALNAIAGDGVVDRIELRHLGRVVGSLGQASGAASLDSSLLAYGDNRVVPMAIYTDGQEVAGQEIVVTRTPTVHPGDSVTPETFREYGIKADYFVDKGASTIDGSDFSGQPDIEVTYDFLALKTRSGSWTAHMADLLPRGDRRFHPTEDSDELAIRFSGLFSLTEEQAGEQQFVVFNTTDSARLLIDGIEVLHYDNLTGGSQTRFGDVEIFLGEGEHTFEMFVSNRANPNPYYDVNVLFRGVDGITQVLNDSMIYQSIVPEPASVVLVILGSCIFLTGRRWQL